MVWVLKTLVWANEQQRKLRTTAFAIDDVQSNLQIKELEVTVYKGDIAHLEHFSYMV